jgi:integrase
LEPPAIAAGLRTVDDLVAWWIETFLRHAPSYATTVQTIRKHIVGSSLGRISLDQISAGKIDLFLTQKERELKPASVNHLRGYLGRAFNLGRRMVDVPKRKVPKGLPDYIRPQEVPPLLASLHPEWRDPFATAIYTGMRKGELFALRKRDVDLASGIITVCRSHDRGTKKGGRAEAVPINSELLAQYLQHAMDESPSDLVFPGTGGRMHRKGTQLELLLPGRRAGQASSPATSTSAVAGAAGPRSRAPTRPSAIARGGTFGDVRKMRFHHLRHTTASLILMSGAELAAVQRIMRPPGPAHHDGGLRPPGRELPQARGGAAAVRSAGGALAGRHVAATAGPGTANPPRGGRCPRVPAARRTRARWRARGSACYPVATHAPEGPIRPDPPSSHRKGSAPTYLGSG